MEHDSPAALVPVDTSPAPLIDSEVLEADPTPAELAAADADAGHYPGQGPAIPSRLNRGMRRAMERKRTRRQLHVYQVANLIACHGMSQTQVCRELGLTKGTVSLYWTEAKSQMGLDFATQEDRESMATYLLNALKDALEQAAPKVGESAAHGVVVGKMVEQIAGLCGIDAKVFQGQAESQEVTASLIEHIRGRSLVLGEHQAAIDAIRAKRERSQAPDAPAPDATPPAE